MYTRSKLGNVIREARLRRGWNVDRLAAETGASRSFLFKLERGEYERIAPELLEVLGQVLELPLDDLLALARYPRPKGLPTFAPYLRSRYGEELPDQAIDQLTEYFELLRDKYGGPGRDDEPTAAGSAR